MKVERKRKKVFEPITIILETKKEMEHMLTIANVLTTETLGSCCERNDDNVSEVNSFGTELGKQIVNLDC